MPIVSVIIPTYKPREYLWKCLQSLRNQTLPSSDFEIILGIFSKYNKISQLIYTQCIAN